MKKIFSWIFSVLRRDSKPKVVLAQTNFKQDMECLFSVIATFIDNERYKITISQKKVLSDSDLLEIANAVTLRTVQTLSDDYKELISRYVSKNEVITFISEVVVRNVVQLGIEVNKRSIS